MIQRVLIANRGEIAVRIIRAARTLGVSPVAVYSEADAQALHVQLADDAVCFGPALASESYLNIERLISAAKKTGCDAVHPGYGFLAERAQFARAVVEAGLTWIGPSPEAIDLLGDKVASRNLMEKAGIPVIPGFASDARGIAPYEEAAEKIGFPLLIKAAAGGGGKGMRVVRSISELAPAIEGAKREALAAFGDERIFLERYIEKPRHIEFQIFADTHDNVVHLYERECSIQRRHQKILEETPSTALDEKLREHMGITAINAVKAANYTNAGTVEFLFDDKTKEFYFLEVNTRIQVEHPITEEVTGQDLVATQFLVAAGETLPFSQSEIHQRGHAIEARIYAEDVAKGFLPSAGPLLYLEEPVGPGIRVDSGVVNGGEVPVHYDPIMAKVIAYGSDREMARRRLENALANYVALGVPTTASFLRDVLAHKAFKSGDTHTNFIDVYFPDWNEDQPELRPYAYAAATVLPERNGGGMVSGHPDQRVQSTSPWQLAGNWRIGGKAK